MTSASTVLRIGAVLCLSCTFAAAAAPPPPPAAPAPGSPALYVAAGPLAEELKAAIAKPSDPALATISVTDQYAIHEVHRGKSGPPAVHEGMSELHFILDGSATFVTGGTIVKGATPADAVIQGGVAQKVSKGDAVLVPPNTPHWYQDVDGTLTYLEVRFAAAAPPPAPPK